MRSAILLLLSVVFAFAQTNRFHISQHVNADGSSLIIKTDLSTGKSWRYDDSYQGTEIAVSEAGQKMKQRLEKIVIARLDPLNGFTLSEAVEVLSRIFADGDRASSSKADGPLKGLNNKKKNQSRIIRAIVPPGLPSGIGTIPPNPVINPATGVPTVPSGPGGIPGAGGGVPGGQPIPSPIPRGVPGGHFIPQSTPPPARFPIFILSSSRSRYTTAGSFAAGIDPATGLPISSTGIDPNTGLPLGGGGSGPNIDLTTGLPIAPGRRPKAALTDDNKTNRVLPPGSPPSRPSGGFPGGLPGVGGGFGLLGMGGVRKQHDYGIDPGVVQINGMRGPVANITAYAALHLVLSLADVPLHCAIDQHGVFIFSPKESFRFMDGEKPEFSKTGRWVEISRSQ